MKKTLVLVLTIALVLTIGAAGTLAWLTSTPDAVTNTFTIGELAITLDEPSWTDDSKLYPGAVIDKDPTVTVAADSEKCYVFVKVDVSADIAAVATLDYNTTDWTLLEDGVYYMVVDATTTDTDLAPVFTEVTVSEDADNVAISAAAEDTIVVTAYAIQFEGFADAAEAWLEF